MACTMIYPDCFFYSGYINLEKQKTPVPNEKRMIGSLVKCDFKSTT